MMEKEITKILNEILKSKPKPLYKFSSASIDDLGGEFKFLVNWECKGKPTILASEITIDADRYRALIGHNNWNGKLYNLLVADHQIIDMEELYKL